MLRYTHPLVLTGVDSNRYLPGGNAMFVNESTYGIVAESKNHFFTAYLYFIIPQNLKLVNEIVLRTMKSERGSDEIFSAPNVK